MLRDIALCLAIIVSGYAVFALVAYPFIRWHNNRTER